MENIFKTVLILANSDAGLFSFRRELLSRLVEEKYRVVAALPVKDRADDLRALGCELIDVELSRRGVNPFADLKLYRAYKKIIKRVRPDVVLTYTIKPNVYGGCACQAARIPYVANITGLGTAVENPGALQKLTLALYKKALKKAQKVFFQNEENRNFMTSRGVVRGACDLLPGSGVNLTRYQAREYPQDETVDFVFVARVMKEKGIDQYLEAAKYFHKRNAATRFHICGSCGDDYREVLERLHNDGVVVYHGVVKDMTAIYRQAHCVVHPTYYPEGLSNVLLEGAASARPLIATDRAGCREVIDDGVNGFVVKQRDAGDLIEKIEKFLALPWEKRRDMGLAGRAKVEREFDRQIVVEKYLKELQ